MTFRLLFVFIDAELESMKNTNLEQRIAQAEKERLKQREEDAEKREQYKVRVIY